MIQWFWCIWERRLINFPTIAGWFHTNVSIFFALWKTLHIHLEMLLFNVIGPVKSMNYLYYKTLYIRSTSKVYITILQ